MEISPLRKAADWRHLEGLGDDHPHFAFEEYLRNGSYKEMLIPEWAKVGEGAMPEKIMDRRAIGAGTAEAKA